MVKRVELQNEGRWGELTARMLKATPDDKANISTTASEHSNASSCSRSRRGSLSDEETKNLVAKRDIAATSAAEFKILMNRFVDVLIIAPAIYLALYFTNFATFRHETAHQFANRAGLYDGGNDAKHLEWGTNLDHLRARDMGFEMIPEEHSEALADIVDVIPAVIGILVFGIMFIASVTRKFTTGNAKDRMCMSMICDACILTAIMMTCRCIFYLSTALPAPDRECVRGLRDHHNDPNPLSRTEGLHHNPTCGDLIFSGHFQMSYGFFTFWCTEAHRFFRGESRLTRLARYSFTGLIAAVIMFQMWGILATRHHYTVDLVVVPFVDYFVRTALLPILGEGYSMLVNRHAILHSNWIGMRLFGNSYANVRADPKHGGPSKRMRIIGLATFGVVVGVCLIALFLLQGGTLRKISRHCAGQLDADPYCRFVHSNVKDLTTTLF